MEGWVDLVCEVAPAKIRTCNCTIANPALYHTATSTLNQWPAVHSTDHQDIFSEPLQSPICMKNPNRVNNIVIAAYFYTCYILTVIIFCAVSFMPFVVFVKLIVWNKACSGPQWTMEDWMWTGSQKVWVPGYCSGLHLSVYISAW